MLLQVTHKFAAQVQDGVLVGGRFLTAAGDKFCVAAYDSCDVICYCAWLLFCGLSNSVRACSSTS